MKTVDFYILLISLGILCGGWSLIRWHNPKKPFWIIICLIVAILGQVLLVYLMGIKSETFLYQNF